VVPYVHSGRSLAEDQGIFPHFSICLSAAQVLQTQAASGGSTIRKRVPRLDVLSQQYLVLRATEESSGPSLRAIPSW